ncbi:MAG: CoA transferase, partial [Syntrophales bacterium]|nr:CoA transferase [Syntrophales bacterium]
MATEEKETAPLTGLRILDLADEKGSFCSRLLADMGTCVTKVERPGGDASRRIGPFWGNKPEANGSLFFWYHNAGKLGITLNLESAEGREIFLRLIGRTDVVVETFPPGYLEKIGLNYEVLSKKNPRLILASVTGFGQTGPYRGYKSCDIVASASGGQMYVCGTPDNPPIVPYGQQSYYAASLFAAVGILIALHERNSSGRGQHLDISLQESVAANLEHVMVRYFSENILTRRGGNLHWTGSASLLPCKDGYIFITFNREWETLVELLDSEGMACDLGEERWKEEEYRREHADYIVEVLSRWTMTRTKAELFELGQMMRFPWAPVNSPEELFHSPQLKARDFFSPVNHPGAGDSFLYPGAP